MESNQSNGPAGHKNNIMIISKIMFFFHDNHIMCFLLLPSCLLYMTSKLRCCYFSFQLAAEGNWMHIQYHTKLQAKKVSV